MKHLLWIGVLWLAMSGALQAQEAMAPAPLEQAAEVAVSPASAQAPAEEADAAELLVEEVAETEMPVAETEEPETATETVAESAAPSPQEDNAGAQYLDLQLQSLKRDVMALNRDLFILEEELLFPSNTQFTVFVAMDVGNFFQLDSVQLQIDGKEVANYLYTDREVTALTRGGVQRFYQGNLKTGEHELVAVFVGMGPNEREYRRAATVVIQKSEDPKFIELKIVDNQASQQPDFLIKEWE